MPKTLSARLFAEFQFRLQPAASIRHPPKLQLQLQASNRHPPWLSFDSFVLMQRATAT